MTQKRGRKPIPEQDKKKPLIVYLTQNEIDKLGGNFELRKMLENYSQTKLKQNAKKEII
jgi:hypothetical protein